MPDPEQPSGNNPPPTQPPEDPELIDPEPPFLVFGGDDIKSGGFETEDIKGGGEVKEKTAQRIGYILIIIFGITILAILTIYFILVLKYGEGPEKLKVIMDSYVSILESLGNLSTAVFAPLLAFVLGYYFGAGKSGKIEE